MANKINVVLSQIGLVLLLAVAPNESFDIQARIINGALSNPDRYPYYVQIRTQADSAEYFCGGSLINDRYFVHY